MKGQILDYSVQTNSGVISGADGSRYTFVGSEWKGDSNPTRGMSVDFEQRDGSAVGVYTSLGGGSSSTTSGQKSKMVAALLAIFLGGIGIHKFYLGYTNEGIIQIVITLFTCGVGSLIALIEGIIYLTKGDEEFEQIYVVGQKKWF